MRDLSNFEFSLKNVGSNPKFSVIKFEEYFFSIFFLFFNFGSESLTLYYIQDRNYFFSRNILNPFYLVKFLFIKVCQKFVAK